jgi:hypothetical protein
MQRMWWLVPVSLSLGMAHAQSYLFSFFDPPGSTYTYVSDMNNSGQILGTYQDSGGLR